MKGKTGEEENVDTEKLQWWSWNNIGWLEDVRKKAISGADNNGQCNISPFLRELNLWKYVLKNYLKIKIDLKGKPEEVDICESSASSWWTTRGRASRMRNSASVIRVMIVSLTLRNKTESKPNLPPANFLSTKEQTLKKEMLHMCAVNQL